MTAPTASILAPPPTAGAVALTRRVAISTLQSMQDRFSALGHVTLCLCGTDGAHITRPTWGSRFSKMVGESEKGRAALNRGIAKLIENPDASVPSVCHRQLQLHAVPIDHDEQRLALMIIGSRPTEDSSPEETRALAEEFDLDAETLLQAAEAVEPWNAQTKEATYRLAHFLADTIAKLYAQAEEIQQKLHDLEIVHGFTELLSGPRDLQTILSLTTRRVVELMGVKACAVRMLNNETGELEMSAVYNLSEEYLRKGPVTLSGNEIDGRAFAGETVYIEDARTDPRIRYPENARREGLVSGLCAPLAYRGKTVGVIRVYAAELRVFTPSEIALLRSIGAQAASAIINKQLDAERVAAERFRRHVEAAAEIQRRMLPPGPPEHRLLQFGTIYSPSLDVGGDCYDFLDLPFGEIGLIVVDVVGKGLPAALMLASIRSALRAHATRENHVEAVVARVNQHLCRDTRAGEFASLFYGVFTLDGRRLTYCNAGHEPPLLLHNDTLEELSTGGLVLGVDPEETYHSGVAHLEPNDLLVLTTDGVTEAMDFQGETYGRDRLHQSILSRRELEAAPLAQQLLWDVRRFVGLAPQGDDITIVTVKCS